MPSGAVLQPQSRVDIADSATSENAKTRYDGTSDMATIAGRRIARSGTQVIDHVQNANAGNTDRPKTRVSTTKIDTTVHATRPA